LQFADVYNEVYQSDILATTDDGRTIKIIESLVSYER